MRVVYVNFFSYSFVADESGKNFRFLPSGDAPPRYSIINFQKIQGTEEYEWRPVGTYACKYMIINRNIQQDYLFCMCAFKTIVLVI